MESLTTVIEDKENQLVLRDLIRQLRSPVGIIPFIGAGMSAPVFPGWRNLLLDNAHNADVKQKIKAHIQAGDYEGAAQVLDDSLGENALQQLIRQSFGEHKCKDISPNKAVDFLPLIASGPVVTTNFDRVLEGVFERARRTNRSTLR